MALAGIAEQGGVERRGGVEVGDLHRDAEDLPSVVSFRASLLRNVGAGVGEGGCRGGAGGWPREAGIDRLDVREPAADDGAETIAVEPVVRAAALAADRDDPGLLEDLEVPGGGGPAVLEARGEVAGGQLAAEVTEEQDELAARLVRERVEHGVDIGVRGRGARTVVAVAGSVLGHGGTISREANT